MDTVANMGEAIVVDEVRDVVDIRRDDLKERSIKLWYGDANEGRVFQRLKDRGTESSLSLKSAIDKKLGALHQTSDFVISNNGTLEELRWRVDDVLFASVAVTCQ